MDEAAHGTVCRPDRAHHIGHSCRLAHIHRIIDGAAADRFDAFQRLASVALRGKFAVMFADDLGRGVAIKMRTQRPLNLGFDRERRQPVGFAFGAALRPSSTKVGRNARAARPQPPP